MSWQLECQPATQQAVHTRARRASVGRRSSISEADRQKDAAAAVNSTRCVSRAFHKFTSSRQPSLSAEIFPKAKPTAHRYQYSLKDEPRAHLISDDWPATRCTVCTQQARNDARKTRAKLKGCVYTTKTEGLCRELEPRVDSLTPTSTRRHQNKEPNTASTLS